uniref:Uncharacterized protein n=1 Tax=Helianthus annuus TaxID=4232 RepID=A0A251U3L0_HELAN
MIELYKIKTSCVRLITLKAGIKVPEVDVALVSYLVAILVPFCWFCTSLFLHLYCMISTTMMLTKQNSVNFFQSSHRIWLC